MARIISKKQEPKVVVEPSYGEAQAMAKNMGSRNDYDLAVESGYAKIENGEYIITNPREFHWLQETYDKAKKIKYGQMMRDFEEFPEEKEKHHAQVKQIIGSLTAKFKKV